MGPFDTPNSDSGSGSRIVVMIVGIILTIVLLTANGFCESALYVKNLC